MKKVLSVLLCLIFICSAFFGCSNSNDEKQENLSDKIEYSYDSAYTFDDSTIRTYEDICKAVVNGEEKIRINAGLLDNALQLFYTSFPLSVLVENIQPKDSMYKITYKDSDHAQKVSDFINKINDIQTKCDSENETVYAINLYSSIASSIVLSDNSGITCYETIMTGKGTSFSYSNMFEYLLAQEGIKSYHILCEDKSGASKGISAAELGGKMYYFDIYAEYENNKGKQLRYFGMTSDELSKMGYNNLIYTNRIDAQKAEYDKFSALRYSKSWKLDGNQLVVTDKNDKIVQVAL